MYVASSRKRKADRIEQVWRRQAHLSHFILALDHVASLLIEVKRNAAHLIQQLFLFQILGFMMPF
jgi:hypothetical protein